LRRAALTITAAVALAAGAGPGAAQTAPDDAARAGTQTGRETSYETTLRRAVATRLARQAVFLARGVQDPSLEDFRVAALTIGEAIELDPSRPELTRLQINAYQTAEDDDGVLEATGRLVRQDPRDTAAQLRLITDRISGLQRIEDRIAAYENLLGADGERLDPSIRSRLAFDAALLTRELGDEEGFIRLLRRAVSLDQTNKPAVLMASALFFEREDDPLLRVDMHEQLLLSDPLDDTLHASLARELLGRGAHAGAERFFDLSLKIQEKRGQSASPELLSDYHLAVWGVRGADDCLETLETEDAAVRYAIENQRKRLEAAGEDPSQIQDYTPDPVRDRVRAMMASAAGQREVADRAVARLSDAFAAAVRQRREAEGADPEAVARLSRRITLELVRLRAWLGVDLEAGRRALELVREQAGDELREGATARYEGLFAAHAGDAETARRLLTPLAEGGDPLARIGLGLAAEAAGDRTAALRTYAELARDTPGSGEGLWARERASKLLGARIKPSETARALNEKAKAVPRRLERMANNPSEHLSLRVEIVGERIDALEPLTARVELKNTGVMPLAVGSDAPVAARLLLAPKLAVVGAPVPAGMQPEVVSLARRLRLEPGESVVADAWLGAGDLGGVLENSTPLAASLRCQAIQGFQYSEARGVYTPSAYSLTASSAVKWRRPERTSPEAASIVERIETAEGEALLRGLLEARWALLRPEAEDEPEGARESIAAAVAGRWGSLAPLERVFALLTIPPERSAPASAAVLEAALAAGPDALQALVMVLVHATGDEDPSVAIALESDDEGVREIARLISMRLELKRRFETINERMESSGRSPSR